jgi:hypothetical protein
MGSDDESNDKRRSEKCPMFDGRKEMFLEWKGKVEDWIWRNKTVDKYPGLTIRSALSGEPWKLVGGLPREEIASIEGVNKIMSVLEKKYSSDKKREKMDSMNAFFRIERKPMEDIQDFVSRFDVALRRCNAAGMAEPGEEHKGGLLLGRSKLSENEEKIMLGALDGDLSYERVTSLLVGIMGKSFQNQNQNKEKIWYSGERNKNPERKNVCYNCKKEGHMQRFCPEYRRNDKECNGCGKKGHVMENCWMRDKECYKCKEKGHLANMCIERKQITKEVILLGNRGMEEDNEDIISAIVDTGCKNSVVGEL